MKYAKNRTRDKIKIRWGHMTGHMMEHSGRIMGSYLSIHIDK